MLIRIFSPTECGLIHDADLKKCGLNRMTTVIQINFLVHLFCPNVIVLAQNDLSKWGTTTPHGHALSTSVRAFVLGTKNPKHVYSKCFVKLISNAINPTPQTIGIFLGKFFCFSCVNPTTYFCKLFGKIHQIIYIKNGEKLYMTMILLLLLLLLLLSLS
jgi:hypothetical protein